MIVYYLLIFFYFYGAMHKYIRKVKRNFVPQSTCVLKMCTILIINEISFDVI